MNRKTLETANQLMEMIEHYENKIELLSNPIVSNQHILQVQKEYDNSEKVNITYKEIQLLLDHNRRELNEIEDMFEKLGVE